MTTKVWGTDPERIEMGPEWQPVQSPVRPVAPREDEPWFRNLNEGVRQLVFEHASRKTRLHLLAAIDEAIDRLRVAAPVPCAASPAETPPALLINGVSYQPEDWREAYKLVTAQLEFNQARATGEGARDGAEGLRVADLPALAGAQEANAAPVAVSLDPHRPAETPLSRALRRMAKGKRLSSLDVPVLEDAADELDELTARLRGEAAVRVEE